MTSEYRYNKTPSKAEVDFLSNSHLIKSGAELASVAHALGSTMMRENGHGQAALVERECGCYAILLSFSSTSEITDGICYELRAYEAIHIGSELAKMGEMIPEGYLLGLELMTMGCRIGLEEYAHGHHFKMTDEHIAAMEAESVYMQSISAALIEAKRRKGKEDYATDEPDPVLSKAIAHSLSGMAKNPIGKMISEILKRKMAQGITKMDDDEAVRQMDEQVNAIVAKEGIIKAGKFEAHHLGKLVEALKSESARFALTTYPVPVDNSKIDEGIKNADGVVIAFALRNSADPKDIKVVGVFGWDDTFKQLVDAADVMLADANETTPMLSNRLAVARGIGVEIATKKFDSMQDLANRYAKVVANVGDSILQSEVSTKH